MRKLFLICSLMALSLTAFAQEAPRVEIFGGYSYLRADLSDTYLATGTDDSLGLHGWNASVNVSVNKWLGVKADFGGGYYGESGAVSFAGQNITGRARVNAHTFLAGPQFSARNDHFTTFGHVLAGVARTRVKASGTVANTSFLLDDTQTGFAMALGGGIDGKLTDHLSIRAIQLDYLFARVDGANMHNFRLSTGLVIRAGKQ